MKVSYNWLKQYISKLPKPEKLADLLTLHSFEVEKLKKQKNDWILDIDILPNRAHDCLSHIGIAREIAALTENKLQIPKFKLQETSKKIKDFISVEIKEKELCYRYTARAITNIKVGPSPEWLKERIEAIGQQSINNVVDLTNYVMFETGQPLHAFDADKLSGQKIIVRKAKKEEKIISLDGEKYELDKDMLVIADNKDPLVIAGVKGGQKAEISKDTKTLILESANFNLHNIHKTSKKLGLRTEASLRFEHGLDPNLTSSAIDRLAYLINKVVKGEIVKGKIDVYRNKIKPKTVVVELSRINSLLGIKISKTQVLKILKSLEIEVKTSSLKNQDIKFTSKIPTRRLDIQIAEDLIEEVGRIYGYENIKTTPPITKLILTSEKDSLRIREKTKNILESLGFSEVYNFSFVGEKDLEILKTSSKEYIELKNPLSLDLKYLRKNLIINILKNVSENFKYFDEIKFFELGKVYIKKVKNKEQKMLVGVIARKKQQGKLFYEIKGVVDSLFNKLGISDCWYDNFEATPEWTEKKIWQSQKSAEIKLGNKEIGFLGEIKPSVLNNLGIKEQVVAFNINFKLLIDAVDEEVIYTHPSKYPSIVRDIAVLVDLGDKVADVVNIINIVGGKLVKDVDLFDMYAGDQLPDNRKNLAFHVVYQAENRTLTDKEVDKIHNKITREINNKNWEVRK